MRSREKSIEESERRRKMEKTPCTNWQSRPEFNRLDLDYQKEEQ